MLKLFVFLIHFDIFSEFLVFSHDIILASQTKLSFLQIFLVSKQQFQIVNTKLINSSSFFPKTYIQIRKKYRLINRNIFCLRISFLLKELLEVIFFPQNFAKNTNKIQCSTLPTQSFFSFHFLCILFCTWYGFFRMKRTAVMLFCKGFSE